MFCRWMRRTLGPLLLILLCPPTVFLFWYTNVFLDGSLLELGRLFIHDGIEGVLERAWFPYFWGNAIAWKMLGTFAAVELFFMRILPGKIFHGPITPTGHVPIYKANGPLAFTLTIGLFYLACYPLHFFSPTLIYDQFPYLLGALNIFSLCLCLLLLIKGSFFPSTKDAGGSGNLIFDYYWGAELYPRLGGWDIKQFTNCRFALMSWPLIIWSFAAKQQATVGLSDGMLIAVALQFLYVAKFFIWETGYLRSLDIMHDRAGYYICWGCLVWVPGIYTSPTLYLVNHPHALGWFWASLIGILGAIAIGINYWADRQRQHVRATGGKCTIWGKTPVIQVARYMTIDGQHKQNLLLASGWWGISRHFHYVPEVLAAFCWSVPALFNHFSPYFYVTFLAILLTDRAFRDDERCALKYGEDWQQYCKAVPYKIIPYFV